MAGTGGRKGPPEAVAERPGKIDSLVEADVGYKQRGSMDGLNRWRTFAVVIALLALGPVEAGSSGAHTPDPRPNILIVVTDDQRDAMRFLPEVQDFFGRGGTRFTRGFANTPLCCPARATLMSGQYPHNHGVWSNQDWEALDQEDTLQADLQAAGYTTAIFGKFLNRFPVAAKPPPFFDRFAVFGAGGMGSEADYYSGGTWNIDGSVRQLDEYSTRVVQGEAVRFLKEDTIEPWLLILALPSPHSPFIPEPAYASAPVGRWEGNPAVREKDRSDKPPWMTVFDAGIDGGRALRRKQIRTLMSADDAIGAVTSALRDTGQADDTLAFFTTDNGYLWGEHGMLGKPSPYLQSIKVPFYARWPGHFQPGADRRRLVAHADMTATAYEAAGVTPEHELDGRSLLGSPPRERLLTEMMVEAKGKTLPAWSSLVTREGEHYIEYRRDGQVVFRELYDLAVDPWELKNVASQRPVDVSRLGAMLALDRDCRGGSCP